MLQTNWIDYLNPGGQLSLDINLDLSFPTTAAAALWARPARFRKDAIVVAFCDHLPYGVALELRAGGLEPDKGNSEGWFADQAPHYYAVLLRGSSSAIATLLNETCRPQSRGSRTPGNLLPW